MKYVKMLGLAAIAAAALMAFVGAGSASATELTCSPGTMCAAPTAIHAEAGKTTLHPPIGDIECAKSTVAGSASTGSSTETPSGSISTLTFEECNAEVVVVEKGSLEVHTTWEAGVTRTVSNNNGTLTSTGAKVTVTFLGFHCIFTTNSTDIGTVTGSANTGGTAVLDISAKIPRTGGRSGAFCGTEAEWTGSYSVDTPMSLNVD